MRLLDFVSIFTDVNELLVDFVVVTIPDLVFVEEVKDFVGNVVRIDHLGGGGCRRDRLCTTTCCHLLVSGEVRLA